MKEIALHMLDIAQNSIRAGAAEIRLTLSESLRTDTLTLTVEDNGKGMERETVVQATDPFFTSRTTRKVGLGLPLLKMNADLAGGGMTIDSKPGCGTTVSATFIYSHPDRPPLGDISGTVALLIISNPTINIIYTHHCDEEQWSISTMEIKEELGDDALTDLTLVRLLRQLMRENITNMRNDLPAYDKY